MKGAGALQGTDIIDQARACSSGRAHHFGCTGIYRDDGIESLPDRFNNRDDAIKLLLRRDRISAGPRRFAAHVNQRCALIEHLFDVAHGLVEMHEAATIGKGVGRYIENAHDMGIGKIKLPVAAGQPGAGFGS